VLEQRGQVRSVDPGAARQLRLGHLPGLTALVEAPHDHRRGEALDADDPEAQAVEDVEDLPQHRGELGEVEQPLELRRVDVDELRCVFDPQRQTLDPAPHVTKKCSRPHASKTRRRVAASTGAMSRLDQ